MSEIQIKNLSVSYENKVECVTVLKDLNATFSSGDFHVIMGASGCGKTTLLRAIAGTLHCEGTILVNQDDITKTPTEKRNIAFVSQEYMLYPQMTIFDNIAFPLKVMGATKQEIRARVSDIAERLEITHCLSRRPKHLSGGQQQRVAIARALIRNPEICLFDEPFSNLDIAMREKARTLIKKLMKETGSTVLYVTHDIKEGMLLADRMYVVDKGKMQLAGTPLEVYEELQRVKGGNLDNFIQ